ncbi:MAG: DUF934 domain-containing protein [Betaproteobacteria bacterium]
MPRLIRDRAIAEDAWVLLRDAASLADVASTGPVIVPLALWRSHREALLSRGSVGVLLAPADDPEALRGDLETLPVIAVDFPQFTDGRGYSTGRLLREKMGFAGELRAVGDVLRDQLYYLSACGFNAFALRDDRDLDGALTGFTDFSDNYQSTVGQPLPLFRRREGAAPTEGPKADVL